MLSEHRPSTQIPNIIVGSYSATSRISRDEFDRRIALVPAEAGHLLPIYSAVRDGRLAFAMVPQGARFRGIPDAALGKPLLTLIGDDLDDAKGPGCFDHKTLRRLLEGAGAVVLNAADARSAYYESAVDAAILSGGKAVLIETRPERESEWLRAIGRWAPAAAIVIITPDAAKYQRDGGRA